ncbi:MAG: SURF1 family protein [Actinomycetota bacterium]|nr:SURF1 family protein [Actinomycetota bacterium]
MLAQPRYAALSVLMLLVATACVLAGTWQIVRLEGKVGANDELRSNAHTAAMPVASVLPLVGTADAPPRAHKIQFRTVRVSGNYDAVHQGLVRQRIVEDSTGFYVLTPLHTADGTLLVVRGFIGDRASTVTPAIPAPPGGTVTVTARVQPGDSRHDQAEQLAQHQLESINPGDQAARLGGAVFDGYAELLRGQPGTTGLTTIPKPDLSNPAGGAIEPQHVAYIIQWYLFALLALGAPVAMVRAETRQRDERDFDEARGPALEQRAEAPAQDRAAKLADRYGRALRR